MRLPMSGIAVAGGAEAVRRDFHDQLLGLRRKPADPVEATSAFARATSGAETRFGSAAAEAGSNGLCATADRPTSPTRASCWPVSAIAVETAAAARSAPIRTRRRSKRSPSQPPKGAATTDPTTPAKSAAETHFADPVSP